MVTIGKIPGELQRLFTPLTSRFTQRAWGHFWPLVLTITAALLASLTLLPQLLVLIKPCGKEPKAKHDEDENDQ